MMLVSRVDREMSTNSKSDLREGNRYTITVPTSSRFGLQRERQSKTKTAEIWFKFVQNGKLAKHSSMNE